MPVSAISRSTSSGMAGSPIDLPETLTSSAGTSCSASRWIALRATQRSISWIRPKRSAVSMKAAGMTISPSSPIMRSSSSYWVIVSVRELEDRLAVEDEAVLVERATDLVGPVQAHLHAADVLAAVGGGDVVAVAAGRPWRRTSPGRRRPAGPRRAAPRRRSRRCRSRSSSRCAGPRAAGAARGSSRACPRRRAPRCRGRRRAAGRRTRRRRGGRPRRSCGRCRAARARRRG